MVQTVEEESSLSCSQSENGSYRSSAKNDDRKLIMKFFTGVGITMSLVGVIWFFASLIVTLKVYHDVKECVHPSLFLK